MSEPTNLKLGKFGSAGNINIDTLKGGVNINDFGQEHITIFKAYDVDKNDILTDNEVQQLKNDVQ